MVRRAYTWLMGSLSRKLILLMIAVIVPALGAYVIFSEWNRAQTIDEAQLIKAKGLALTGAEAISHLFETALTTGQITRDQLFDTKYQPIANTNPQKYHSSFDGFADNNLVAIQDKYLNDQDVLYAVAVDINGYLPTHNTLYSQPLTGDYKTDLTGNRTKRIFSDTVGLAAAVNTQEYLWQFYPRDNGQLGWDISTPIMVNGEHWGAFRIGISLDRLNATKLSLMLTDLAAAVIIATLVVAALYIGVRRSTRPLNELSRAATQVAAGDLKQTVAVKSHDEIGTLADAFNNMTAQLNNLVTTLEDRVQARTQHLRVSAEVAHAATSIQDPNQLLDDIAELITGRFQFYYTGVFLLDETGQQAVLRAATGQAGQILLARGHHLPVDNKSMVGTAIITGRPRIALDVGQDAVRFANPLLPNTRSEIALPLRIGDRRLGALDVQSEQTGAFDANSAEVLQTMADQIAVALSNAEAFQRAERQTTAMALLNELSRGLTTVTTLEEVAVITQSVVTKLLGQTRLVVTQTTVNPQLLALREFMPDPQHPLSASASIPAAGTLIGECIRRGQTIYLADLSTVTDQFSDVANFYRQGVRCGVALPLRVGEHVLGTFNVGTDQVDAYSAEQVSQLEQIAAQLAVTIENLNLAEQTQETLAELNTANRQLIGQAWEQYSRATHLAAAEWRDGEWRLQDPQAVPQDTTQALITATPPLLLPIKVRGTVVGEIQITATDAQSVWDEEDASFAQSLVDQVGQVLETARLLDETERTARREKAVAGAADKIHRATDLENVLQSAVTELQRITGRRGITVQLGFGRNTSPDKRGPNGDTGGER